MITVHLVLNAHIDPAWLWPWQAGLDEVVATCRSACERLDANPDIVFTRGEAWAYDAVERIDPALFNRIRAHVAAGRWEIVGGWWVQPDCNLPSLLGLQRQIDAGRAWFESRFGVFPRVAYNVDSFGHAAALPKLLRANGQDRYVMMRPQEHEKALPARLFRWRSREGGDAVTTFRIARSYATGELAKEHIEAALTNLPAGVGHTMAFVGVGDHGGGPTERQIAWCREHAETIPGCRLAFSSPSRFFDAIEQEGSELPDVAGELQHHAVGCYSVLRSIKLGMRDAEAGLGQAETMAEADPAPPADLRARLAEAWRTVAFNQFHDILGGTCIPSANAQAVAELLGARAAADEALAFGVRRLAARLPDAPRQRLVLFNAAEHAFEGYVALAPWTEARWRRNWRFLDENGAVVPHQPLAQEAATAFPRRVLVRLSVPARRATVLHLDRDGPEAPRVAQAASPGDDVESLGLGDASAWFGPEARLSLAGVAATPALGLFEDLTDTWSHGVDRLGDQQLASANWAPPRALDRGQLMCSAVQQGEIGDSRLTAEWRVYAGEPLVELLLSVHWRARHQLLKLALPLDVEARVDGVMGEPLRRALDGCERPIQGFTWLDLGGGRMLGVVCPDVFALDADPAGVRLTLLRSPLQAHHDPAPAHGFPRAEPADQGVHHFRFQFVAFDGLDPAWLKARAEAMLRPLVVCDWTAGMPARGDF
ncbi:MAG TPA: glycoside hydrolase family 38 C-terminal domain-containing protein [Caulobacteraceae bacterium]|nr:glycoside hydrolase family 38 C-terminal domain-containing protein [Caulobacteraceae bacterium]